MCFAVFLKRVSVERDPAGMNQGLDARARELFQPLGQPDIQRIPVSVGGTVRVRSVVIGDGLGSYYSMFGEYPISNEEYPIMKGR